MDLSISIVNWNNKNFLKLCLDSIYKNTKDIKFEIIVVDNNSSDCSADMIREDFPFVKIIVNTQNEGYAKANNKAIKISKGKYILILNPDTLILDNTLKKMLDFMDDNPDIGLLGCKYYTDEFKSETQSSAFRKFPTPMNDLLYRVIYKRLESIFPKNKLINLLTEKCSPFYDNENIAQEVSHIAGAAMLTRREIKDQNILLDENFFSFFEDTDWCRRIKERGWKIYYLPDAEIVHFYNQAWGKREVRDQIHYESFINYVKKHHGLFSVLLCRLIHRCSMLKKAVIHS